MPKTPMRMLLLMVCFLMLAGCTRQGWRVRWGAPPEESAATETMEDGQADLSEDAETQLRRLVAREMRAEERNGSPDQADVVRLRPYYVKQYVEFPEGPESFEVTLQDTDSRTAPLKAEVGLAKIRYATKLHRDRRLALADDDFVRSSGTEVVSYEYRMGRWRRLGSTFVASRTEQRVDGQWVALRRDAEVPASSQPQGGWMRRTFGFITGD